MSGNGALATLDVVIGLVFVFFLLSIVCSALNEGLAALLGWRAKTLETAIRSLLADDDSRTLPDAVLGHWRIDLLRNPRPRWQRWRNPSYIPPRAFSLAVTETLAGGRPAPADASGPAPRPAPDDGAVMAAVADGIAQLPVGRARDALETAVHNAGDGVERFRMRLEDGFDDTMERATGWYKRKVQIVLVVLAATLAIGLNVDTVHVATRLWNDQAVRTAVAQQAVARADAQGTPQEAADAAAEVRQLQLPIGWGAGNAPTDTVSWLSRIPGWLITIAALSAGAPFWFDVLGRLAALRATGLPQDPRNPAEGARTGAAGSGAGPEPADGR